MSRQVRVGISGDLFTSMLTRDSDPGLRVIKGLPDGALYVRCFDDAIPASTIWLLFEHESFGDLKSGDPIPPLDVLIEKRRP